MREPTAPFANHVRGYPHILYEGKSLFANAKKISSQVAYLSLHFVNEHKHVSYLKLGKYKGGYKAGDWRQLLIEVLDLKIGKSKVIGKYHDELGPPTFKNHPSIINFRQNPFVVFNSRVAKYNRKSAAWNIDEYWQLYNIETQKSKSLQLPTGYAILGTFNLVPIMYSQATFSEHLVLGRIHNGKLKLRVVSLPDLKTVFAISTDAIKLDLGNDINSYSNMLQADYIMKGGSNVNSLELDSDDETKDHNSDDTVQTVKKNPAYNLPMLEAAYDGKADSVKKHLRHGADPNAIDSGWTALMYAAWFGHTRVAEILMKSKADASNKNDGYDALSLAQYNKHYAIQKKLEVYSGRLSSRPRSGKPKLPR